MPLTRRRFLAAAGGVGLGVGLGITGCGSTAIAPATGPELAGEYTGPPVTISFWNGFTGGDGPAMRRLVTAFNESQDRIVVAQNTVRWEQFYQRVVAAVHAGKGPDVGALHLEQMGTQAGRQTINPLDDVVDELGLRAEEYPPNVWQAGVYRDRRYGIPFDVHSLASFANTDLLGRVAPQQPGDAAGMAATMTALQQAGVENPFWVPNSWPAHLIFLSLLWQHGGEPYALDGSRATFDSDAGIAALSWMRQQVDAGFSPANVSEDSQYTAFKNGQVTFTWDGIWQINDLQTNAPDLPWSLAPLPRIGDQAAVLANSHQLVMFRSREPDDNKLVAVKAFVKYLTEQSAAWTAAGMIPARSAARQTPDFAASPQAVLEPTIPTYRFLPTLPGVPDVQSQTLEIAVQEVVLGRAEPAAALRSAAEQATTLMQANLNKFRG